MFEKQKQHIRILKKLKSLKRAKNACSKNSEEYKVCEHAYLHLRDRYLDIVLGAHDKGQSSKGAVKRYKRKFKHLGWGFVLRQVGMGMVIAVIRRPIQLIVTSVLALAGVKYFEQLPECSHDASAIQALTEQIHAVHIQSQAQSMKLERMQAELNLIKELMAPTNDNKPLLYNNESQMTHILGVKNTLSSIGSNNEFDDMKTVSQKQEKPKKFIPQQIDKKNSPDKKGMEFKPINPGITRVGANRFVYKFPNHKGRVS